MTSRFGEMLVDLARQVTGVERLLQETMQGQKDLAREITTLREKVAKLEKGEEWSGEERRKVDQRLGTGDHTFEKLRYEVSEADKRSDKALDQANAAMNTANAVLKYVEGARKASVKAEMRRSSRIWFVVKLVLQHSIPLVVAGLGTLVALHFAK